MKISAHYFRSFVQRKTLSKLIFSFLLLVFSFSFLATNHALAQTSLEQTSTPPMNQGYAPNLNSDVPKDQHSYVQTVVIEIMSSAVCQLSGIDPIRKDKRCLGINPQSGKIGFVEGGGGAIGLVGKMIAFTFTPPVSTTQYTHYLANNFGFPKKTYASESDCATGKNGAYIANGVGFCSIQPLLSMWVAMRNIAYLIFVVIFIVIGLAIMLRVKIDPRTVMTVQNQIPKIIIGILLVTFSFAIAGFLIDIMYLAIYIVGGVLLSVGAPSNTGVDVGKIATSATPFDAINQIGGFGELSGRGASTVSNLVNSVIGPKTTGFFGIFGDTLNFFVGIVVGIFASLVILIALLYTAVRLWIILLIAYISILLDIIFAPFWFLSGLLPGSTLGVGAWFRDMLGNLAVFPTTIAMFILAKIFFNIAGTLGTNGGLFTPPLTGVVGNPIGPGGGASVFAGLVALGFLFMTPHVLQITKGAVKAPKLQLGPVLDPAGAGTGALLGVGKSYGKLRGVAQEAHGEATDDGSGGIKYGRTGYGRALRRSVFGG